MAHTVSRAWPWRAKTEPHHGPNTSRRVALERRRWRAYADTLREGSARIGRGRGVVTIGGTTHSTKVFGANTYTVNALLAIAQLRWTGCRLPVELWHDGDPELMTPLVQRTLRNAGGVSLRSFQDIPGVRHIRTYELTLLAFQNTAFDEILYIDADNFVLHDPTPLFDSEPYRDTGAVFWPDFYVVSPWSSFWSLIEEHPSFDFTFEVGQALINLRRHWKPVELTAYFNKHGPRFYYELSHGECELFLLAWFALSAAFHLSPSVALAGDVRDGTFCGHTILQGYPELPWRPLFAHRSHDTFSDSSGLEWRAIKHFHQLFLAPLVSEGMRTVETWRDMVVEGASVIVEQLRSQDTVVHARHLANGWELRWLPDQSKCVCIDSQRRPCWDSDGHVETTAESAGWVAHLRRVEGRVRVLRAAVFDRNLSQPALRPGWHLAWARLLSRLAPASEGP